MPLFPNNSNDDFQSDLPQRREQDYGLPSDRVKAAKKQARKWFAILLTIGLVVGGVMAIGVAKLIKELGLNKKPERAPQIELFNQ